MLGQAVRHTGSLGENGRRYVGLHSIASVNLFCEALATQLEPLRRSPSTKMSVVERQIVPKGRGEGQEWCWLSRRKSKGKSRTYNRCLSLISQQDVEKRLAQIPDYHPEEDLLFFSHIHKTSGTSLRYVGLPVYRSVLCLSLGGAVRGICTSIVAVSM